jgi:hypothetical protein
MASETAKNEKRHANGEWQEATSLHPQQQDRFHHELEGVDLLDGGADFGLRDWFDGEEQRQALFG